MGDVFMNTYHPKTEIKTIVFNDHHNVLFPSSTKIVTIILVIKNGNINLAKVIYSDLSNDNIINDFFYNKISDQWNRITEKEFDDLFVKISNKLKTFNINSLSEKWYNCSGGLTDQKLCTIQDNYLVKKIIMGNSLIWENEYYHTVYAIGMSVKEQKNENKLLLKIYCTIDGKNHNIELEVEITKTHVFLAKKAWGLPTDEQSQAKSDLEKLRTSLDKVNFPISHQSRETKITLDSKTNRDKLKEITLETEPQQLDGQAYRKRYEIILELNTLIYEPNPGIKVKLLKDGNQIIWNSDDFTKHFIYARFFYKGESPIFLNIKYLTKSKFLGISRSTENNQYLIKFQRWHILSEEKFNEELRSLSNSVLLGQLDHFDSGHCSVDVDRSETEISDSSQTYTIPKDEGPRLKNITLELFQSETENYRVSGYLMDGLDTTYYEPTHGALVKRVKDGDNTIWDSDDGKRTLKYAKFCYKKDSKIFLSVLYSTINENQTVDKTDYFIKRDKWYHSTEKDFQNLFDLLVNKVTMRARVINEKLSFDDHIKDLDVSIKGPKPNWIKKNILRKKQSVKKFEPFEYDINDDGHDKFIIDVNMHTKFGIYTPQNGLALSRIKDKDRVIWFQETNGLGCTTLYMDFSGEYPLIHLIIDDPLDSNIYYKKLKGNWHVIDENEYEKIRKNPKNQPVQSDFVRINNNSQNED